MSTDAPVPGVYTHRYTLTRADSMLGVVIQGTDSPYAGSCRNAWCALVPSNATNGVGQSGGTFSSFSAAAHEVVRVWNVLHLSTFTPPPVVSPPSDTTPSTPAPSPVDSSYTTTRIDCPSATYRTCYNIRHAGILVGWVRQYDTTASRRWEPGRDNAALPGPLETTLKAAALRLVLLPLPTTPSVPIDTAHHRVDIFDTVRTTVTMPPDTLRPRVILPVDTVLMRVGDPPLVLQAGDTVKIPIKVLPPCTCGGTPTTGDVPATDTIPHTLPSGTTLGQVQGADTTGLHIYDWPSRVGENNVYLGTVYLGRVQEQTATRWLAYRYLVSDPDPVLLRRDCATYATKALAMQALATYPSAYSWRTDHTSMLADSANGCAYPPGTTPSGGTTSSAPELPRAILNPEGDDR